MSIAVHIFRRDLRLADNTALLAAAASKRHIAVLPVFILPDEQIDPRRNAFFSHAAVQFMVACLKQVDRDLSNLVDAPQIVDDSQVVVVDAPQIVDDSQAVAVDDGDDAPTLFSSLLLVRAKTNEAAMAFVLDALGQQQQEQDQEEEAGEPKIEVYFNADDSHYATQRDSDLAGYLSRTVTMHCKCHAVPGDYGLLPLPAGAGQEADKVLANFFNKVVIQKKAGFVPDRPATEAQDAAVRRLLRAGVLLGRSLKAKSKKKGTKKNSTRFLEVAELDALYTPVARPIFSGQVCSGGRVLARIKSMRASYSTTRDALALEEQSTTRASAYLKFGTISVRQAFQAARGAVKVPKANDDAGMANMALARELVFREFYRRLYAPRASLHMLVDAYQSALDAQIPWRKPRDAPAAWAAWTSGRTGVPLVDAGMHQLLETGFVHNRARMVVASFATRYLLFDWRDCAKFYYRHLVDADALSNSAGWQWAAGVGVDSAPFFRFPLSPLRQSKRFDPNAEYVKRYVPALRSIDARAVHRWNEERIRTAAREAHPDCTYDDPIIDLATVARSSVDTWKAAAATVRASRSDLVSL